MKDQCESAQARATLAKLVAASFVDSVGDTRRDIFAPAIVAQSRTAADSLGIPVALVDQLFCNASADEDWDESRGALLGHSVRSQCPPYELEYRRGEVFQQAQELADICGFYRAFGLELSGPTPERADHIVAEWEFLSMLALKEAAAYAQENLDGAQTCRDGQRQFLKDHAAVWMPAFFRRLKEADTVGCFTRVVVLAERLLHSWCDEFDVTPGADWLELRPVEDGDMSISCDSDSTAGIVELGPKLAAAMAEGE